MFYSSKTFCYKILIPLIKSLGIKCNEMDTKDFYLEDEGTPVTSLSALQNATVLLNKIENAINKEMTNVKNPKKYIFLRG